MKVLALALVLGSPARAAADPCGGVTIADGLIRPGAALPAVAALDTATAACVEHIGQQLVDRSGLRSVTITVKLSDAQRAGGTGEGVIAAYRSALLKGKVPASRISGVVGAGQGQVLMTFSQRPARPVGAVDSVTGQVSIDRKGASVASVAGDRLQVGDVVSTGPDSRALLVLADKSRVRVQPGSRVVLAALKLNDDLERVVELEVTAGAVDVDVTQPGGSFGVRTSTGAAGVRGTVFRMIDEGGATRLETLEGEVGFGATEASMPVAQGYGSRALDGAASEPVELPRAPKVTSGLHGAIGKRGLTWRKVRGAGGYVVELARDAEFVVSSFSVRQDEYRLVPELEPGLWFWRVAAESDEGFLGSWSTVHAVEVPQ